MRLLLTLLISLMLVGCPDPTIITKIKYVEVIEPPAPRPLDLHAPYFYVVSKKNLPEFLERIENDSNGVFFAMTPKGYELLAGNIQEFRRYILECKEETTYYKSFLSADPAKTDE